MKEISRTKFIQRKGSMLLLLSGAVAVLAPIVLPAFGFTPDKTITGAKAVPFLVAAVVWYLVWTAGFIRYAKSKGYSAWVGFWLAAGQYPSAIVLLLLPDRLVSERPN